MKYLFPAILFLSLTGVFIACGGTEDEEEPSALEQCETGCSKAADCYDESGSSSYDVAACKDGCKETIDEVREQGCKDEYEALASCALENFSCNPAAGSGDGPCEAKIENFLECYDIPSVSGS